MDESVVRFPAKCPMCGQDSLLDFGLDTILHTLATDRPIKLYANCAPHRIVWVASDMERRQIRDYMAAVCCSVPDKLHPPPQRFYVPRIASSNPGDMR